MKEFWLNLTLEGEDGSFDCFPADPLKDGEVDPKHLLRLVDFKSYQSLQEKYGKLQARLEEKERECEEISASHKRQCDLNDKAWEKFREVEKDYQDALEVVKYYASEDTWISKKFDKDGNLDEWMPKKPNDVSIFPYSIGTSNGNFHCLGKRARDFLGQKDG